MGKCIKNIALSVMAAIFGALALSGPVFATPATSTETPTTTDTSVVAPADTTETPTETPTTTAQTDDTTTDETTDENQTCYDQVGNLGWLVCPGTGLLSKIIDGAYGLLTQVIQVNPIPTDQESPYYIVWEYFKNITNLIFVIFFLVVIFSQLTGVGINNYGIKKVLPRIIITAILVNLSYIVCTIAVDVSNILGNSLHGFFMHVQDIAVQNGTISADAKSTSVAAITYAILGIGAAGAAGTALVFAGSIEGLLWMLAPVLLSGVIAVLSALIIMAARQALIYLLVMVSPLAFVAYMLPNTESWFSKWYKLFARMILFYPMFSVLYGASQLAGLVIIASSDNPFMKVLGIAVEVVPLFMSIPLMRMSGTALNKIDGIFHRMTAPLAGAAAGYAASQSALARQKAINAQNPIAPHTRLAQYLEKRKAKREFDTAELAASNRDNNLRYARDSMFDKKGRATKRAVRHYANEQRKMENEVALQQWNTNFDEGFKSDGTDKRIKRSDYRKVQDINNKFDRTIIDNAIAQGRARAVSRDNTEKRANTIREHAERSGSAVNSQIMKSWNIDAAALAAVNQKVADNRTLSESEKNLYDMGQKAISTTLADAISAKRKVDNETRDMYFDLYDDTPAGGIPKAQLEQAIINKDYNKMVSAAKVMAKRGDHGDIIEVLQKHSASLVGNDAVNVRMQKELNDFSLSQKGEDSILWAWGKANMIRRGKHDAAHAQLSSFIDLDSFMYGRAMENDAVVSQQEKDIVTYAKKHGVSFEQAIEATGNHGNYTVDQIKNASKNLKNLDMVNLHSIFEGVRDNKLVADMDRTVFKRIYEGARDSEVEMPIDNYYFTWVKGFRDSVCSGKMDGEQLDTFNNYMTMGLSSGDPSLFYRQSHDKNGNLVNNYDLVNGKIEEFFRDMSANQLASLKSGTFSAFNDALNTIDREHHGNPSEAECEGEIYTTVTVNGKEYQVNKRLKETLLAHSIGALQKNRLARSGMNPVLREILGISLE